jgi:hypothetical protein
MLSPIAVSHAAKGPFIIYTRGWYRRDMGWVIRFLTSSLVGKKNLFVSVSYKIKPKLPCIGKYEEKCIQYILYQNRPSVIEEGLYIIDQQERDCFGTLNEFECK